MSSGSWDISDLISGNLVITDWSADNSVNTDLFWDIFGTIWKVFLRAFGGYLDHQNQSSISRVIVWMKFVTDSQLGTISESAVPSSGIVSETWPHN